MRRVPHEERPAGGGARHLRGVHHDTWVLAGRPTLGSIGTGACRHHSKGRRGWRRYGEDERNIGGGGERKEKIERGEERGAGGGKVEGGKGGRGGNGRGEGEGEGGK